MLISLSLHALDEAISAPLHPLASASIEPSGYCARCTAVPDAKPAHAAFPLQPNRARTAETRRG